MPIFVRNQSPVSETFFHQPRRGRWYKYRHDVLRVLVNDVIYPVNDIFQEGQQIITFRRSQPLLRTRQPLRVRVKLTVE